MDHSYPQTGAQLASRHLTLKNPWVLGSVALASLAGTAAVWAALGQSVPNWSAASVAKVNGQAISRAAFDKVWSETREQSRALEMQENRQVVLDSIVGAELLAQRARQDSAVMADPQVQAAMEMQTRNLLANAYVAEFLRRSPATDAALKAAYDQLVKDLGATEYKLHHVLLAKQEDAEALHGRIMRGEVSFTKALESTEEKTQDGKRGNGDIGWLPEGRLNGPLKEAATQLKGAPGIAKPYSDQFGWHIVQFEESRPLKAPAFDAVRGELIPMAQRTMLREHLAQLKEKANIKF